MNTFRTALLRILALAVALPLSALLAGCTVDSTTSTVSDSSGTIYNFSGLYMNSTNQGASIVFPDGRQSGTAVTWLRLIQYGSVLEGYDNASQSWAGKISGVQSGTASFSLQGKTSAGAAVDVIGTMTYVSQQSAMDASWLEPGFSGSLFAKATVSPATTNNPVTGVTISPTSATLTTNSPTKTFTASGGTGTYTWSHSGSCGTLSGNTGSSVTYTRTTTGSDILSVTASSGGSGSATITCQ